MAIVKTPLSSELVQVLQDGNSTVKRYFKNIKTAATDADVFSVSESILGLQSKTLDYVERREAAELEDDGN
jgi:hypothetical protein